MDEVGKLKKHLSLLRDEYVKLQTKSSEIERKYNLLVASTGGVVEDNSFVSKLLKTVAGLYDKELYSDLTIKLKNSSIKGHKFILSARSDTWGTQNLSATEVLDLSDIPEETALALIKWVYTDHIELNSSSNDEDFALDIMKTAKRFNLTSLVEKCEITLISSVNVKNCVRYYQMAEELGVELLRNHCSSLISNHWDDFTSDDFAHMSAPLLFAMFKAKTGHPLHTAIRVGREDVVFLFLIEHDSQLASKVNEIDKSGDIPLDLALKSKQEGVAKTLMTHKANVNACDGEGKSLLHRAISRQDEFSANFLIDENAQIDSVNQRKETPLHLLAAQEPSDEMTRIVQKLLIRGADANIQDVDGNTPVHKSILCKNIEVFKLLVEHHRISFEIRNKEGLTPLALALRCLSSNDTFSTTLVQKGCSVDATNPSTGDTLLHLMAQDGNETAGIFLVANGCKVNSCNNRGETPLHLAAYHGLTVLVDTLLKKGANCNMMTSNSLSLPNGGDSAADPFQDEEDYAYNQTPLHLAILGRNADVIDIIVKYRPISRDNLSASAVIPNLNLKNSKQQTPLSLALQMRLHSVAQLLIDEGANINFTNSEGMTLLHEAIISGDQESAMFLLNYGADTNTRTPSGETPLELAVKHKLEPVVRELCLKGADLNAKDDDGNTLLWTALINLDEDVASVLVQYGCDTNCWGPGPSGCWQTLLHKALDENNEDIACFLIRSGCDVDCTRKPSPDGEGDEEAYDGQTPLHLACTWGLERVVQSLLEFGANVNTKDSEGKSPLQVAIMNQNPAVISLLLSHPQLDLNSRDKYGSTAFATAMSIKNNKAAQAILDREPTAAERHDGKGRNFLHLAIQKGDIESVLFLLSINVNIHSRVMDSMRMTPLHLAVESGSDLIVRNLLLAGANINETTTDKKTALHFAAEKDHFQIISILLENGIDFNAVDTSLNNALHVACQYGNLASGKVLLAESQIDAEAVNLRGQNCLHLVSQFGRENSNASIFDLFISTMPEYPINKVDAEGNSPLLLAYINGNWNLCRALVQAGACLGQCNRQGINIFNSQVASKNLLYRLLDYLPAESPWAEGDSCLECGLKFGITTRKHHCRHCGRILCGRCSAKEMPILKFNQNKPVRVCDTCFEVLTLGFNG